MGQGKSREIRAKINSVKNTEKITKAMKLVSASKLGKANKALDNFGTYYQGIESILHKVISTGSSHKLAKVSDLKRALIAIYSGERALCGAYNANSVKEGLLLEEKLRSEGYEVDFFSVGKKGAEELKRKNKNLVKEIHFTETIPALEYSKDIANDLLELFQSGEYGEIHLVYTRFVSAGSRVTEAGKFLPYHPDDSGVEEQWDEESEDWVEKTHYFFEPSKEVILESLFTQYLGGKVHHCFLNSLSSEYGARMVAMDNASRNAKEMIAELTLKLNRARQAAITQEIAEIVGGAASLE